MESSFLLRIVKGSDSQVYTTCIAVEKNSALNLDNNGLARVRIIEFVFRMIESRLYGVLQIREMLLEYLESHDMAEAGACIAELQLPQYDYYIVKRALTVAADRKDRDREAISALLSHLYGQYVSPQQMQKVLLSLLSLSFPHQVYG
jgi:hypothetical protein